MVSESAVASASDLSEDTFGLWIERRARDAARQRARLARKRMPAVVGAPPDGRSARVRARVVEDDGGPGVAWIGNSREVRRRRTWLPRFGGRARRDGARAAARAVHSDGAVRRSHQARRQRASEEESSA